MIKPYTREIHISNPRYNRLAAKCSLKLDEHEKTISLSIDNRRCSEEFMSKIDEKFELLCNEFRKEKTMKTIVRFERYDLERLLASQIPGKQIVKMHWIVNKALDQRERDYVACECEVEELPEKGK